MRAFFALLGVCVLGMAAGVAAAEKKPGAAPSEADWVVFTPRAVSTYGSVRVGGREIAYRAVAGTIIVHARGWDDAVRPEGTRKSVGTSAGEAVASMFYVAYLKRGADPHARPVTFLFNGGPGSSRVAGPSIDPLSERAEYDPREAALGSAYMFAFNQYVRETLRFGYGMTYESSVPVLGLWSFWHAPPGQSEAVQQWANVMPDLANALKYDPRLKIMVNEGYFDLSTPFMQGWYEMHHLQLLPELQGNVEYHFYRCGHMRFVPLPQLERLHDRVARFIAATDRLR